MISFKLVLICSYSIVIAVIIGLVRFRKIYRAYQPFIFITMVALTSEIISTMLIMSNFSNAFSTNILNLVECMLWLWQFKRWEESGTKRNQFLAAGGALSAIWIVENIVMQKIVVFSSIFTLAFSFCLVFLAINQVNKLIVREKGNLLRNSKFLICSGVLIFYTYRIMVESFYIFEFEQSSKFLSNIFSILVLVNLFVNLLYALATLWIPTRQKFTMQY